MRSQQLEARVLQLVEQVLAGRRVEDDRVECKGPWPSDHRRAARQIAGLANAAAGEPILWIVGLDEDSSRLVDPGSVEPSTWWGKVAKVFAEVAPEPNWLNVPLADRGAVTAILFDTSRAPYVVTTDGRSGVHREIPWRVSGSTRSAHRSEILRAVVGEAQVPQIEPISGRCRIRHEATKHDGSVVGALEVAVHADAYLEASEAVTLPEHRWVLRLLIGDHVVPLAGRINGPQEYLGSDGSLTSRLAGGRYGSIGSIVSVPDSGLLVSGPERISLTLHASIETGDAALLATIQRAKRVQLEVDLPIALSARVARMRQVLRRSRAVPMTEGYVLDPIDARLGEFTHDGGPHQDSYDGEHARSLAGYERPVPEGDPRAILGE